MVVVFSIRFVGGNDEKYFMFSLYGFCGVGYVLSLISLVIMFIVIVLKLYIYFLVDYGWSG